jgi:hypothetical protein
VTTLVRVSDKAAPTNAPPAGLVTGIAYLPGARPALIVADASGRKVSQYSLDGTLVSERTMPGPPVAVAAEPPGVAIPGAGTLLLAAAAAKDLPFAATEEMTDQQAATLRLKRPVGLFPLGKDWLATGSDHGAVLRIVGGKAQVVAGFCTSADPVYGYRDGDGEAALFSKVSGVVFDGKRYAYVADTGNNCIRRLDISELIAQ